MDSKIVIFLIAIGFNCNTQAFGDSVNESGQMKGWEIHEYGGIDSLQFSSNISIPEITTWTDVLVEVNAISINPLDQLMTAGYGHNVLNNLRRINRIEEFPLILGREFTGVVKAKGRFVRNLKIGDRVWGVVPPHQSGSLAEYVVVNQLTVSRIPNNVDDVEAAGILFAGLTAWSSLYVSGLAGGLTGAITSRGGGKGTKLCILGASGGVGTLAVQIARAEEMNITAVVSTSSVEKVRDLGADRIIDYTKEDVNEAVHGEHFDIVLDAGGLGPDYASKLSWTFHQYISLEPPILNNTDSSGIFLGSVKSALSFIKHNIKTVIGQRGLLKWGFFLPAPQGIEYLRKLVDAGKLKPIVDSIYSFDSVKKAFEKVAKGHLRGKVLVKVQDN